MHLIFEDANGNDPVECRHCHWQGTIKELKRSEYLSLTRITELDCPNCNKYVGFIQHGIPGDEGNGR